VQETGIGTGGRHAVAERVPTQGTCSVDRLPIRQRGCRRPVAADLARWTDKVRNLPDLRWDKVLKVRNAMSSALYDEETLLEATLTPLGREIELLLLG